MTMQVEFTCEFPICHYRGDGQNTCIDEVEGEQWICPYLRLRRKLL